MTSDKGNEGSHSMPLRHRWRRLTTWPALLAFGLVTLVGLVLLAESAGWPFLAGVAERQLAQRLQRSVSFSGDDKARFQLHLLGGIRLQTGRLTIGNASWADAVPMVDARDLSLALDWRDLLAVRRGEGLRLQRVGVHELALNLQRTADGRANWHFSGTGSEVVTPPPLSVGSVVVEQGQFTYNDAPLDVTAQGRFAAPAPTAAGPSGWTAQATGRYRGQPLRAQARTGASLGDLALGDAAQAVPVTIAVDAGQARLHFKGTVQGTQRRVWDGSFDVAGSSLAAVGQPMGLVLPTTAEFSMAGRLHLKDGRAVATVSRAVIGRSELAGDFVYDTRSRPRPTLRGELRGRALWLQDLGPAVGTAPAASAPRASAPASAPRSGSPTSAPRAGSPASPQRTGSRASTLRAAAPASAPLAALPASAPRTARAGRVLPTRTFDLPSMSRMDAEVNVRLDRLELGHPRLRSIQPLLARLSMKDGVLRIDDIDARLAQGRIKGLVHFDGRRDPAIWKVDLSARGLVVEEWIVQDRAKGAPPYLGGRLSGGVQLDGRGRSTAQLLASSNGRAWLVLSGGRVSHLAIEMAGLDIAQSLGVALRGDDALPISCGAADLRVRAGRVEPQVLLVDTTDSTAWAEGSLSLADEQLDLTVRVEPKDFSPLALRSPLLVRGTLAEPVVSIEKGALARRLVPAALLGMLNPLAALLPLLDKGDDKAQPGIEACRQIVIRRQKGGQL